MGSLAAWMAGVRVAESQTSITSDHRTSATTGCRIGLGIQDSPGIVFGGREPRRAGAVKARDLDESCHRPADGRGGEPLDLVVFAAGLAAALMHAGWNAVIRIGLDRFSSILLLSMTQSGLALILLPFAPLPAAA